MRIYLVQHGQAKSEDIDPDRHLTEKGIADVKKISCFLKGAALGVDVIWHSGKARAAQTAEILSQSVVAAQGSFQHKGLSPNDDVKPIKDELLRSGKDVMIVGHLPFLSKLSSLLLTGSDSNNIVAFQQGGVVCLEQNENILWQLRWMVVPDLLP